LRIVFHLFGYRTHTQQVGDFGDRAHDRLRQRRLIHIAHETAVDLQIINLQITQVAERTKASAEVVQRETAAHLAHALDKVPGTPQVPHHAGFGNFQTQLFRQQVAALQPGCEIVAKLIIGQCRCAQIEVALADQGQRLRVRFQPVQKGAQHIAIQSWAQPKAFCRGNQAGRWVQVVLRIAPAQQDLEMGAAIACCAQIHYRLAPQCELALIQGLAHIQCALHHAITGIQAFFIQAGDQQPVATQLLGLMAGGIHLRQQFIKTGLRCGAGDDANAGSGAQITALPCHTHVLNRGQQAAAGNGGCRCSLLA